ncbi:MAG: hypothetical protein J3R72DRAFT_460248 [Linnemannia gamsii]|nr:MAG: hypothetical protein J3R72DRAFT_460248 [Linnemannia gamsii]
MKRCGYVNTIGRSVFFLMVPLEIPILYSPLSSPRCFLTDHPLYSPSTTTCLFLFLCLYSCCTPVYQPYFLFLFLEKNKRVVHAAASKKNMKPC